MIANLQRYCLDLMHIPRWILRNKTEKSSSLSPAESSRSDSSLPHQSEIDSNTIASLSDKEVETLKVIPLRTVTTPAFISIVTEQTLNQEAIALANAIAKACGVSPENHLILSTAIQQETHKTLTDFLPIDGKDTSGFIVLFGVPNFPWKNEAWKIVETSSLAQLATEPQAKKQLWKILQSGMNAHVI